MNRHCRLVVVAIFALMLPMAPAAATSAPAGGPSRHSLHADTNRNGLSDSLEQLLRGADANEQFEVIVTWKGPANASAIRKAVGPFTVLKEFTLIDGFLASANAGQVRAMAQVAGVFRVDENFSVQATNYDTDREYGAEKARIDYGVDGTGIDVCVVDTGADPNHEQLDSQIAAFHDSINGLLVPYDDQGHGTHVAATIAGDGIGGPQASNHQGIAPGASLYIAKVLNAQGSGTTAQIVDGLEWCVAQGVDIVSASLGGGPSDGMDALAQAFNNVVVEYGITATVAAGNSGDGPESVETPGSAEHVLTVGASSKFKDGLRLAPFSGRGPNLAGLMKPDIVSPGVAITSARANTTAGYVSASGTSMATPFTAGIVALALELDPTLTPDAVKNLVTSTAHDMGTPGHDANWGAGLIDGYGLLSTMVGNPSSGPIPDHTYVSGSVTDNGVWSHTFPVSGDAVGQPLGITILIDGEGKCTAVIFGICWISEWSPDLDARLTAPDGTVSASQCPLQFDCGTTGVQEVFYTTLAQEGDYTLEVYPFDGTGGPFGVDIFMGLPGEGEPPPPVNQDPTADAGSDHVYGDSDGVAGETVTLDGSGSADLDGTIVSWEWSEGATPLGTGEILTTAVADGVHSVTLTVTDDDGATATDDVIISVEPPPPPPPVSSIHVGDLDTSTNSLPKNRWNASVTVRVHDELEDAVSGATVTFMLSTGTTESCVSNAAGECTVWSPEYKKGTKSVIFTVTDVVAADVYQADANHDPDGDSNGLSITALQP